MVVEVESVTRQRSTCPHQSDHNLGLVKAGKADACWVSPMWVLKGRKKSPGVPVNGDQDHRMR